MDDLDQWWECHKREQRRFKDSSESQLDNWRKEHRARVEGNGEQTRTHGERGHDSVFPLPPRSTSSRSTPTRTHREGPAASALTSLDRSSRSTPTRARKEGANTSASSGLDRSGRSDRNMQMHLGTTK